MAWGKKRDKPPRGTEARRYWDEVMARLTAVLREKGIVRLADPDEVKVVPIALVAPQSLPLPVTVEVEQLERDRPRRRSVA